MEEIYERQMQWIIYGNEMHDDDGGEQEMDCFLFLRKNKNTLKEGDMPKRRKYDGAVVWKK